MLMLVFSVGITFLQIVLYSSHHFQPVRGIFLLLSGLFPFLANLFWCELTLQCTEEPPLKWNRIFRSLLSLPKLLLSLFFLYLPIGSFYTFIGFLMLMHHQIGMEIFDNFRNDFSLMGKLDAALLGLAGLVTLAWAFCFHLLPYVICDRKTKFFQLLPTTWRLLNGTRIKVIVFYTVLGLFSGIILVAPSCIAAWVLKIDFPFAIDSFNLGLRLVLLIISGVLGMLVFSFWGVTLAVLYRVLATRMASAPDTSLTTQA